MKLDSTAKLAEIIASLAVIVSLIVLIFEIRENTDAARRATYESLSSKTVDWRLIRVTDPSFNELYDKETAEPEWLLKGPDRTRFMAYIESLWQIYEQAFYAYDSGSLGQSEWRRFEVWICNEATPEHVWDEIKDIMSTPFVEFVDGCRNDQR